MAFREGESRAIGRPGFGHAFVAGFGKRSRPTRPIVTPKPNASPPIQIATPCQLAVRTPDRVVIVPLERHTRRRSPLQVDRPEIAVRRDHTSDYEGTAVG